MLLSIQSTSGLLESCAHDLHATRLVLEFATGVAFAEIRTSASGGSAGVLSMRCVVARRTCIAGAILAVVLAVAIKLVWRDPQTVVAKFDPQVWLNCRYESGGFRRFNMLRDIVDNHIQPGTALEYVRRILGDPESTIGEDGDGSWIYYVRYCAGVEGHRYVHVGCFVIDFRGGSAIGVDLVRTPATRTRIPF